MTLVSLIRVTVCTVYTVHKPNFEMDLYRMRIQIREYDIADTYFDSN
jgi:hypothetical protein